MARGSRRVLFLTQDRALRHFCSPPLPPPLRALASMPLAWQAWRETGCFPSPMLAFLISRYIFRLFPILNIL